MRDAAARYQDRLNVARAQPSKLSRARQSRYECNVPVGASEPVKDGEVALL
jgi:hypothetical protein